MSSRSMLFQLSSLEDYTFILKSLLEHLGLVSHCSHGGAQIVIIDAKALRGAKEDHKLQ